ncbi:precorrin-6Y C5,15-methyltransferase subunit CbiT [Synechococcus sp. O70.2]|uniref:precorrin-6Y C5,15-methyltransferase subunit CbiT n=1 Tax=Synechococcus sp. O70.2 TaxID=2964533 RepID=UPI0039C18ADE
MTTPFPWPYRTPGIPDSAFERIPGIPMSPREVRVLVLSQLRLGEDHCLWDIGAGTGTIAIEAAILCPRACVIAIERDAEVVSLIESNCQKFGLSNVQVIQGTAPECLHQLSPPPDRLCIEGGHPLRQILEAAWHYLKPNGRVVATTNSLEDLYGLSVGLAAVGAHQVEVIQAAVNRLESRGRTQLLLALDPTFVLSGEKSSK